MLLISRNEQEGVNLKGGFQCDPVLPCYSPVMHRRISTLVKSASSSSSSPSSSRYEEKQDDDTRSTSSTVVRDEGPVPVPSLKIKRVDYYYSRWTKSWKYKVCI